jgi:hypothetical protein
MLDCSGRAIARRFRWLAALLVLAGCGQPMAPAGPQPYPVRGKVLDQGKPAVGFHVAFHPLAQWDGPKFAPSATTDENGEFQLRSYEPGDGAPVGEYAVTFEKLEHIPYADPDDPQPPVDQLRGRYGDPQKSQFKVTVHEGENTLEPFVLK